MRPSSWVILGGAAVAAGVFESSFVGSLPYPLSHIRPLLPLVVMLILLNRSYASFFAAGIAGLFVDLLRVDSTGFTLARWLIIAYIADFFSERVLTNRSLSAAWILMIVIRLLDFISLLLVKWIAPFLLQRVIYIENWRDYLVISIFDLIIVSLMFVVFTLFTRRFLISLQLTKERYGR